MDKREEMVKLFVCAHTCKCAGVCVCVCVCACVCVTGIGGQGREVENEWEKGQCMQIIVREDSPMHSIKAFSSALLVKSLQS